LRASLEVVTKLKAPPRDTTRHQTHKLKQQQAGSNQ
jgi:hypothetical protein